MSATTRRGTDADLEGLWELFQLAFGVPARQRERWVSGLDPDRALLVEGPRGEVAAAAHIEPFRQWYGGRAVPLAGYSPVAVLPEFRGRGWGREVTVAHLPDLRDRGEVIAGLFPAAAGLYRPLGFEVAGSYVQRRFPARDVAALAPDRPVEVRRGRPVDVDAVHRCHRAVGPGRDGTLWRDEDRWQRRLPRDLGGVQLYVVDHGERPGEVAGYAICRTGPGREPYDYSVVVSEVVADDPDVVRALWRVVASSGSQAPDLDVIGPAEDDLFLLVDHAAPDVVRSEIRWMLRLVDLPAAVAARGWPAGVDGAVHLAVRDPHASWNDGRWILEVEAGRASARPGGSGTVEATIGGLSSWWAGYATARRLARTGHLRTADPAALAVLDRLLPAAPPVLVDFY